MSDGERAALIARLRTIVEWVSEHDHARAVELDAVVYGLECLATARQADEMSRMAETIMDLQDMVTSQSDAVWIGRDECWRCSAPRPS